VGLNHSDRNGSIFTSYSTGPVSGDVSVGGLVGKNQVRRRADTPEGIIVAGFWNIGTSEQTASDGGRGLTTAAMQTAATFLEAGWDFADETENGTEDIWWILEGQDYPRLWWEAAGQ